MPFTHQIYFDSVRASLFSGTLNQRQVDGQDAILTSWETYVDDKDLRWLAYMLATTYHETSKEMQPIEEYNKGKGQPYGVKDPETGQTYYGRGFVQLTWRDNYARADKELNLSQAKGNSLEWQASNALLYDRAAMVMYLGMTEGWFRSDSSGRQTLMRYFNDIDNDAYGAREIINGDKKTVPSWSNGVSIGNLIKGYHQKFLTALENARVAAPPPPIPELPVISVTISCDRDVVLIVNGTQVEASA